MLFVQGVYSEFVPESMLFDNYYAYGGEREMLTRGDAEEHYFERIFAFLEKHFN